MTEDEIRIDREIPVCFPSEMEEGMAPEERVKCLPKTAHFLVQERKAEPSVAQGGDGVSCMGIGDHAATDKSRRSVKSVLRPVSGGVS